MPVSRQELFDVLSQLGRALGNGHRLALLEHLAQKEAPVEELAGACGLSIANASQHLQHLRRAGMVTARRDGRQMVYRLTDERIPRLLTLLQEVAETHLAEMERLMGRLSADDDAGETLEPMTRVELQRALEQGAVTLLDVRPNAEYQAGHLPGALNAPIAELESMLSALPRDREIVAYCRGVYCAFSHDAARLLRERGFQVRRYQAGILEWRAAGLPLVD